MSVQTFFSPEYENYLYVGVANFHGKWVLLDVGKRDKVYRECIELATDDSVFDSILIMRATTGLVLK